MPYIIVTTRFPLNKAKEVAQKYIEERQKNPPDRSLGKEILQGAIMADGDKIKTIGITEVKEGKGDEALIKTQDGMVAYHVIEGYEYKIEIFFSLFSDLCAEKNLSLSSKAAGKW